MNWFIFSKFQASEENSISSVRLNKTDRREHFLNEKTCDSLAITALFVLQTMISKISSSINLD